TKPTSPTSATTPPRPPGCTCSCAASRWCATTTSCSPSRPHCSTASTSTQTRAVARARARLTTCPAKGERDEVGDQRTSEDRPDRLPLADQELHRPGGGVPLRARRPGARGGRAGGRALLRRAGRAVHAP